MLFLSPCTRNVQTKKPVANCDPRDCVIFFGPISNISVLSEFKRRILLVIQYFTFLKHSVSLDNLEVSSGLVEI